MKKEYKVNNLVIGNLQKNEDKNSIGVVFEVTEQQYIFEFNNNYKEVLSEIVFFDKENKLNKYHVVNTKSFTDVFPELEGKELSKIDLIWYLNIINSELKLKQEDKKEEDGFKKALRIAAGK